MGTVLVSSTAFAGELTVTGSAGVTLTGEDNSNKGNGWTMGDSLTFSGSAEQDNGWNVTMSQEIDGGSLDDFSIKVDMGDLGTVTFAGHCTTGVIGNRDALTPTANEEAHGVAVAGTQTGGTSDAEDSNFFIFDYTALDGVAIKASYNPSHTTTRVESSTEIGVHYTGVDGLNVYYAMGENNDDPYTAGRKELRNAAVTYAAGSFTVGYQVNEVDSDKADKDQDFSAIGISYQVNDDVSVSLNQSSVDYEQSGLDDQDATGVSISYTQGGMTVSASHSTIDNVAGAEASDNLSLIHI